MEQVSEDNDMIKKLHDLPKGSKLYMHCLDGSEYVTFNRIDGSFSHCTSENGNTVHVVTWAQFVQYRDGYELAPNWRAKKVSPGIDPPEPKRELPGTHVQIIPPGAA